MQKRVLIACEYSGRVRDAFKAKGWYAMSCDLLPTENPGKHTMKTLSNIIEESNGKFVSVVFTKKDGTLRSLNGRIGVVKHLKGGKSTVDHDKYLVLFDVINGGYRCVNRETIQRVTVDGIIHFANA